MSGYQFESMAAYANSSLEQREAEVFRMAPQAKELKEQLLGFGGERVIWHFSELYLEELLKEGRRFKGSAARLQLGRPCNCHGNVAELYLTGFAKQNTSIASGYALSADGLWRQHSWGLKRPHIIETTSPREMYYGFLLRPAEALAFSIANTGEQWNLAHFIRLGKKHQKRYLNLLEESVQRGAPDAHGPLLP